MGKVIDRILVFTLKITDFTDILILCVCGRINLGIIIICYTIPFNSATKQTPHIAATI